MKDGLSKGSIENINNYIKLVPLLSKRGQGGFSKIKSKYYYRTCIHADTHIWFTSPDFNQNQCSFLTSFYHHFSL
ncbi:hypothetical protein C8N25_11334 [Algoriphagus antarcticus]|uniref:Uncharacterized protein n=1 Tax=Algoriphagus antarcticus TaxID=238540 RepID=A0A3E0DQE0_9BACT|nr:hypothetical protein C8N25_11334 [Algoriphagus antarcticus]